MNVRISFFDYNINFGGAPKGSISLCSALKNKGFDVSVIDVYGSNDKYINFIEKNKLNYKVIYPNYSGDKYIGGINLLRFFNILKSIPEQIKIIYKLRMFLKKDKCSLIWVNNKKSLFTLSIASIGLNIKKILYHRGWAEKSDIDIFYRFLIVKFCNALVGHSHATVNNLKAIFPKKRIEYVPNSVKLDSTYSDKKIINNSINIMLPAARPVKEKGHDIAVEALYIVKKNINKRVNLFFPGTKPEGDQGEFFNSLIEKIKSYNLIDNVDFIGWVDDLPLIMKDMDIVILPSETEGFPRVIIESMLLKVPVIATPVGGIPEAIFNEKTGFIFNVGDYKLLAKHIINLINNPLMRNNITCHAYDFAHNEFSEERQVELISILFREVQ